MKKIATFGFAAVIMLTSLSTARADPYHYSNWAKIVWPNWTGAYASAFVWGAQEVPWEATAYWYAIGDMWQTPTWPSDTTAWFRTRARCYASYVSTTTEFKGTGGSVLVTGNWVPPDATGYMGGGPDASVKCPSSKPYAFEAQTQVASILVTGFVYGN